MSLTGDDVSAEEQSPSVIATTTPTTMNSDRRNFFRSISSAVLCSTIIASASLSSTSCDAYDNTFPQTLDFNNDDVDLISLKKKKIVLDNPSRIPLIPSSSPTLNVNPVEDVVWGLALWFLSGSRSNPLVTPVANVLYDPNEEPWLQDRNEGLFAPIPLVLTILLATLFIVVGGIMTDNLIDLVGGFDSLQLAGVSLIGGGALELGRLDGGLKSPNREEIHRESRLNAEFETFAKKRLKPGGNCHKSEVVRAFRRFYGKYRNADSDNPDYALSDLEVERLLRYWNRSVLKNQEDMTSSGFFRGVQLDDRSDVLLL